MRIAAIADSVNFALTGEAPISFDGRKGQPPWQSENFAVLS